MKPRLLDLFCCAGGAAMGYHRAGFEVVGVDLEDQPRFPFEFHRADAMEYPMEGFDAIHASPPCQRYSQICRAMGLAEGKPDLIKATRERLIAAGVPYVMENVKGAPLINPFELCGATFGLGVRGLDLSRHRYFESNIMMLAHPCQHRRGKTIGVYGNGTNKWHREKWGDFNVDDYREAMGIDWMVRKELSQAIPPAYTEWIGKQLIRAI